MTEYLIHEIDPERDLPSLNERVSRLPEWRRRDTLSYTFPIDRLQSAIAWELLSLLLRRHYGILPHAFRIVYNPEGRPALAGHPDIHISISHCPAAVMAAISDTPIGCDIEQIRRPYRLHGAPIADYCFTHSERRRILTSPDPAETFTRLWTIKEAIFKLSGIIPTDTHLTHTTVTHLTHTTDTTTYIATIAQ